MRRSFIVILTLVTLVAFSQAYPGWKKKETWKNLKILPQDITQHQMDSVMHHFSISLNVGCDFCHVDNKELQQMDFASDANKHKLVAREMMEMTYAINDKYFDYTGAKRTISTPLMITCYSCHNGAKVPATEPGPVQDTIKKQ